MDAKSTNLIVYFMPIQRKNKQNSNPIFSACTDGHRNCPYLKQYCNTHPYVKQICKKSCGLCKLLNICALHLWV